MLWKQQQQQSFSYLNDDICTVVILEEAEKLYNDLTTKLTNDVMAAAAAIRVSSLPLSLPSNNMQNLTHKNDEIEEPRYNNNWSEIYNNDQQHSYLAPLGSVQQGFKQGLKGNRMPDLNGLGLKDALYICEGLGLKVDVNGFGRVSSQSLTAGVPVERGQVVKIGLGQGQKQG